MTRKKCRGTELSVFKGREAKLNRAIMKTLSDKGPLAIWDIKKQVSQTRGLKRTRYSVVNTRVRSLETAGYLRKTGERETKVGGKTSVYETTAKALFALLLNSLCLDDLINELDEISTLTIISLAVSR